MIKLTQEQLEDIKSNAAGNLEAECRLALKKSNLSLADNEFSEFFALLSELVVGSNLRNTKNVLKVFGIKKATFDAEPTIATALKNQELSEPALMYFLNQHAQVGA